MKKLLLLLPFSLLASSIAFANDHEIKNTSPQKMIVLQKIKQMNEKPAKGYKYLTETDLKILEKNGISKANLKENVDSLKDFNNHDSLLYKSFLVYKAAAEYNLNVFQPVKQYSNMEEMIYSGNFSIYTANTLIRRGAVESNLPYKIIPEIYNKTLISRIDVYSQPFTSLVNNLCKEYNNMQYDTTNAKTFLEKAFLNEYNSDTLSKCYQANTLLNNQQFHYK